MLSLEDCTERFIAAKTKNIPFDEHRAEINNVLADLFRLQLRLATTGEGAESGVVGVTTDLESSALAVEVDELIDAVARFYAELCISNHDALHAGQALSMVKGRRLISHHSRLQYVDIEPFNQLKIDFSLTADITEWPHIEETKNDSDAVYIEFFYQDSSEDTYAIVSHARSGAAKSAKVVRIFSAEASAEVFTLTSQLTSSTHYDERKKALSDLLDYLEFGFGNIVDELSALGAGKVILVPHRFLHLVPWHAVCSKTDRRPLFERVPIVTYASSAHTYLWAQSVNPNKAPRFQLGCCVDVSGLDSGWSSALIAMSVAGICFEANPKFNAQIVLNASIDELQRLIRDSSCFIYEGHGGADVGPPASAFLMSRDGPLYFEDLLGSNELSTIDIAILNACKTGASLRLKEIRDEYYGVDGALIAAGARSVISTLWPVNDHAAFLIGAKMQFDLLQEDYRRQPGMLLGHCVSWLRNGDWKPYWEAVIRPRLMIDTSDLVHIDDKGRVQIENLVNAIDAMAWDEFADPVHWASWKHAGWGGIPSRV